MKLISTITIFLFSQFTLRQQAYLNPLAEKIGLSKHWKFVLLIGLLCPTIDAALHQNIHAVAPIIENDIDDLIVIEGTVIQSNQGFYNEVQYSSCIVEVNTIFQGEMEERVIEIVVKGGRYGNQHKGARFMQTHGQIYFPAAHSTAIFKIKKCSDKWKALDKLTPYKLYRGVEVTTIFPTYSYSKLARIHVEKDIYQKLESSAGQKRKKVFLPATNDEVAIRYCINKQSSKRDSNLLIPNRSRGLVYKLIPVNDSKKEDYIGFHVIMSTTNSVSYLDEGELIVQYDTKVFGKKIVSSGKLHYDIPRNYQKNSKRYNGKRYNAIPHHFEVTLKDLSFGKFKINWKNTLGVDNCLQIIPGQNGIFAATLYFLPLDKEEKFRLNLTGDNCSLAYDSCTNVHYDYEQNMLTPFEYVATDKVNYFGTQVKDFLPATITNIVPDKIFQPLDTVQLIGKNFMNHLAISMNGKGINRYQRHRKIPSSHILNKSDSLITIIIPELLLPKEGDADLSEEWYPTSGNIAISKGYGQHKLRTHSKAKLKIIERR